MVWLSLAWLGFGSAPGEVKVLGVNTGEGIGEQAGMKEEERHETKQRRIWAVNPPAGAVHWAVTQGAAGAGSSHGTGEEGAGSIPQRFPSLLLPGSIREGIFPQNVGWGL